MAIVSVTFHTVDASLVLGIVATVVSLLALGISSLLSVRQAALMHRANQIPAIIQLLSEFRSHQMHENYEYVTKRLNSEHDPGLGISRLPESTRKVVLDVAYYLQIFAFLIGFEILEEAKVLAVLRNRIVDVWDSLAPYVSVEREAGSVSILIMFEALAERAKQSQPCSSKSLLFKRDHMLLRIAHRLRAAHLSQRSHVKHDYLDTEER